MDWECAHCTYINTDCSECECCGAKCPEQASERPRKKAKPGGLDSAQHEVLTITSDDEVDLLAPDEPAAPSRSLQQARRVQASAQQANGHALHAVPSGSASGLYVLDNCGCHGTLEGLTAHVQHQLQQTVLQASTELHTAVAALACPKCCKHISNQDLYKLVGGTRLAEAYAALAAKVKQAYEQLHPAVTVQQCSSCPQGTLILAASCLHSNNSGSANKQQALPSKHVLHAALQARGLNKTRSATDSAAALAAHLGPNCKHFCTGCTAAWPAAGIDSPAAAAASSADAATAAAVETGLRLWGELVQLQQVMLQGVPAAVTAVSAVTRKGNQQSKTKRKETSQRSGAWAAGTGYGGDGHGSSNLQKEMTAAANRQQATDSALEQYISNLHSTISTQVSSNRHNAGSSSAATAAAGGLSVAACAALLAGPLAWLLRLLFSNDSLMDLGNRQELYRQGMKLLSVIGSSPDLLPLLQLPADDPRDSSNPAAAAAANPSSSSTCTLLSVLQRLQQQANLFRKSAADLMDDADQDTTAAVCLALDISSLVQDVSEAYGMFAATMVLEKGAVQLQPVSAAAGDSAGSSKAGASKPGSAAAAAGGNAPAAAAAAAAAGRGSSNSRSRSASGAAPAAGNAAAANAAAAAEAQYVAAMRPYQFIEADLLNKGNHYFRAQADKQKAAGGDLMRKRLRRITEELGSLSTSLPLSSESSILVACDNQRMDVLRALLLPHAETPYGGGAFLFDILLPESYPNKPPMVHFLTTGGGSVRFNPNLYDCGKVCLSLLGTWSGPSWEPGVSTLLQVLVSLQSMVFVPDPYFNEPGYESQAKTPQGKQQAQKYNHKIRLQTARHAVLGALQNPDPIFKQAIKLHYGLRGEAVVELLQQWVKESGGEKTQLTQYVDQIKAKLSKLPKPSAAAPVSTANGTGAAATGAPAAGQVAQQQQEQHARPIERPHANAAQTLAAEAAYREEGVIDLT